MAYSSCDRSVEPVAIGVWAVACAGQDLQAE